MLNINRTPWLLHFITVAPPSGQHSIMRYLIMLENCLYLLSDWNLARQKFQVINCANLSFRDSNIHILRTCVLCELNYLKWKNSWTGMEFHVKDAVIELFCSVSTQKNVHRFSFIDVRTVLHLVVWLVTELEHAVVFQDKMNSLWNYSASCCMGFVHLGCKLIMYFVAVSKDGEEPYKLVKARPKWVSVDLWW